MTAANVVKTKTTCLRGSLDGSGTGVEWGVQVVGEGVGREGARVLNRAMRRESNVYPGQGRVGHGNGYERIRCQQGRSDSLVSALSHLFCPVDFLLPLFLFQLFFFLLFFPFPLHLSFSLSLYLHVVGV